jgi:hypothetical protein
VGKPRPELLPAPVVHARFAAFAALAAADQERPSSRVEVGFGEVERFANAQPGPPQHDDQSADPVAPNAGTGLAHHGYDLFHSGRVGRVAGDPCSEERARRGSRKLPTGPR